MNIYGYLIIAIIIIGVVIGGIFGINKYIDNQVEIKYSQKVADLMIEKQNQALLDFKIPTELYKTKKEVIYKTIEKEVPVYAPTANNTCEEQLAYIDSTLKTLWH